MELLVAVKYATHQVREGWVCRILTGIEFGRLFDVNTPLPFNKSKGIVPRLILTKLIGTLNLKTDQSYQNEILKPRTIPIVPKELDNTWLRALNRSLPHLWR